MIHLVASKEQENSSPTIHDIRSSLHLGHQHYLGQTLSGEQSVGLDAAQHRSSPNLFVLSFDAPIHLTKFNRVIHWVNHERPSKPISAEYRSVGGGS